MAEASDERRITLVLGHAAIQQLDQLRTQWGMRSRGPAIMRLLEMVQGGSEASGESDEPEDEVVEHIQGALVLVSDGLLEEEQQPFEEEAPAAAGGIDLPGFVSSRRTQQLRRSLRTPKTEPSSSGDRLQVMDGRQLQDALLAVQQHWMHLYGSEPGDAVLEAAMHWLGHDIWPCSDAADGQPFTWNALQQAMLGYAPSWELRDPSVDRVLVAAGVLEDPFGAAHLTDRVPSLLGRMMQRLRRRRRGSPFLDLQATMSVQSALQLLELPITPGRSHTLAEIREAYRLQALAHHPDAGGNPEEMRRLNEAYQLLKQRFRR